MGEVISGPRVLAWVGAPRASRPAGRDEAQEAAGPLAIHIARHGRIEFGEEIEIRQGAEIGRPSVLHARVNGSPADIESVEVGGAAVIVARGEFCRW